MVTVAHLTKKMLKERLLLEEYLKESIINYVALAEKFKPRIENELGKPVKVSAIAQALRRIVENSKTRGRKKGFKKLEDLESVGQRAILSLRDSELIMKGGLCDIVSYKSPSLFQKLKKIYELVDFNTGDTLNIVHGNYDVSIIINEKFKDKVLDILKDERVMHIEKDLVALTLKFGKKMLYTPGVTFSILKQLVLENINLIEIVSSLIEITFIINKRDSAKGYRALQEFIEKT